MSPTRFLCATEQSTQCGTEQCPAPRSDDVCEGVLKLIFIYSMRIRFVSIVRATKTSAGQEKCVCAVEKSVRMRNSTKKPLSCSRVEVRCCPRDCRTRQDTPLYPLHYREHRDDVQQ